MSFGNVLLLVCLVVFLGGPIYGYVSHQQKVAARKLAVEQSEARAVETARKAAQDEKDQEDRRLAALRQTQIEQEKKAAAAADAGAQQLRVGLESSGRRMDQDAMSDLQSRASAALKDPSSAQFQGLELKAGGKVLCGEINAKNSYGGYVGFRPFVATSAGAAIWNGGCTSSVDVDSKIACVRESLVYITAAVKNDCKSQQEINATLLRGR